MSDFSLPSAALLEKQAKWLAPARARLLRRAAIAHRRSVLDLGAGRGAVIGELVRRCGGQVTALDLLHTALHDSEPFTGAQRVNGDARRLPFASAAFDLLFCQLALLWITPLDAVTREVWRVLQPGGVFIALEPDYGGMIEYPPESATREVWLAGLTRAGANPYVGRQLPALLESAGFTTRVDLLEQLFPPDVARFALLEALPLTSTERDVLQQARNRSQAHTTQGAWSSIAHLPFFLITATKRLV